MNERNGADGFRVGVIGLGKAGRECTKVLLDMGCTVSGTDANETLRARFGREFDVESYAKPAELYASDLDAVIVTTPPKFHEKIICDALDRGLDVFIENPLADSVESAERIAETAAAADGICMLNVGYLFNDEVTILKSYLDEGLFGDLMHVDVKHVNRRHIPRRGSWYTSESLSGGGVLMDRGTYPLAILLHLNDWPAVDRVMAMTRSEFGQSNDYTYLDQWGEETSERIFNVEDSIQAMIEFENGCTVSLLLAWAFNQTVRRRHDYEIFGTDAGAELEIAGDRELSLSINEVRDRGEPHYFDAAIHADDSPETIWERPLEYFIAAAETETQPELGTVEQGMRINRLIDRIYRDAT